MPLCSSHKAYKYLVSKTTSSGPGVLIFWHANVHNLDEIGAGQMQMVFTWGGLHSTLGGIASKARKMSTENFKTDMPKGKLLCHFGFSLWSRTSCFACSWTINNLEEYCRSHNMLQDHIWNVHCSWSIKQTGSWYRVHFKCSPGAVYLENSFRLWMVKDHKVLTVQEQMALVHWWRPKCPKRRQRCRRVK